MNANAVTDHILSLNIKHTHVLPKGNKFLASLGDPASDFRRQDGAFMNSISSTLGKMKTQLVKPMLGGRVLNNVVTISTYSGIYTSS